MFEELYKPLHSKNEKFIKNENHILTGVLGRGKEGDGETSSFSNLLNKMYEETNINGLRIKLMSVGIKLVTKNSQIIIPYEDFESIIDFCKNGK